MQTLKWEKTLKKRPYMSQNHQVNLRCRNKHSDQEQKNKKHKTTDKKYINK